MFVQVHLCTSSVLHVAIKKKKIPAEGIYGSPDFSEVSAFGRIRETQKRYLSASIDSQMSSAKNSPYAKVVYFGVAYFDFIKMHLN